MNTKKIFALSAAAALALGALSQLPAAADPSALSDAERADLVRNRDEERLARDLYTAFATKYPDAAVFSRIASSEQHHFDRVGAALVAYRVADPSAGKAIGEYAGDLSSTYRDLLARGMTSRDAALRVGAEFERHDIAELDSAAQTSDNPDLDRLYGNLKGASEQHLAAFTRVAADPGATCDQTGAQRPGWAGRRARQGNQAPRDGQNAQQGQAERRQGQASQRASRTPQAPCDGTGDCHRQPGARRGR